jgi:phosphatidylserine/phosphatidylglycerophosphate/cardiolipin synthase-like enzyme
VRDGPEVWFLTSDERGNPATSIDARHQVPWTDGNLCRVLIHGRRYFARLLDELVATGNGDSVYFTDWRGDGDERLAGVGSEASTVLCAAVTRGAAVRGLLWRSHPDAARFSEQENLQLADAINDAGGTVFADERVRRAGSHHQKLFVIRHGAHPADDVAFVGGIDLSHGRNDDEHHRGDPQAIAIDHRYGPRPAWHDLQVEVHGPAIGDLEHTFRERWHDPTPLTRGPWNRHLVRRASQPRQPPALPPQAPDPPPDGPHAVQVLRTYPARRPRYPFAPDGERSIAHAYLKAFARARRLIYIEDQYLWSSDAANALADALRTQRRLRVVVVVPAFPDEDGRLSGPANRINQLKVLARLRAAGGQRFAAYHLERTDGVPIYVHAKVCIVDDVWMTAGSDNVNRRSWTHDSELTVALLDSEIDERAPHDPAGLGDRARVLPRATRLALWAEHVEHDDVPVDPDDGFELLAASAAALENWHARQRLGPRPAGRVRVHRPEPVSWWIKPAAAAFARLISDPDGRPRAGRLRRRY